MREIEAACALPFTDIVNNTNLAHETTSETVLHGLGLTEQLSELSGLPVWLTTAEERVAAELAGRLSEVLPMRLQEKYFDLPEQKGPPKPRPLFG